MTIQVQIKNTDDHRDVHITEIGYALPSRLGGREIRRFLHHLGPGRSTILYVYETQELLIEKGGVVVDAETPAPTPERLTAEQIKHMVSRFLGWRLPENFAPDAGISFKPTFNDWMPEPMKHSPSGTNLFDAKQAEEMVRYMIEGMPTDGSHG